MSASFIMNAIFTVLVITFLLRPVAASVQTAAADERPSVRLPFLEGAATPDEALNLSISAAEVRKLSGDLDPVYFGKQPESLLVRATPRIIIRIGGSYFACSAAIFRRKYLLTSAHCVVSDSGARADWIQVRFNGGRYYAVRVCMLSAYKTTDNSIYDLALLTLSANLPRAKSFGITSSYLSQLEEARAAGYGENGQGNGKLLWNNVFKEDRICPFVYRGKREVVCTNGNGDGLYQNMVICSGDSGGPLYKIIVNSRGRKLYRLFGINSQVWWRSSGGYVCGKERAYQTHTSTSFYRRKIIKCVKNQCTGWDCWDIQDPTA